MPPLKQTGGGSKKAPPQAAKAAAAEAKQQSAQKAATLKATKADDKKDVKNAKVAAGKVVGQKPFKYVGFDPSSTVKVKPKKSTTSGGGNGGGGGGNGGGGGPEPVVSTPVETVVGSSGLVNGVNYKEEYLAEIKRLVLNLVKTSKSLLLRYNFSGIDRVPEAYLDADREAKSEALSSSFLRPESPFTLEEADLQDKFSIDLNEINNLISDLSNSAEKSKYFGSMRGGTFLPKEVKLLANGSVGYDMRLEFTSISNQDFIIKCYEVS
jgi:hypothetical protein